MAAHAAAAHHAPSHMPLRSAVARCALRSTLHCCAPASHRRDETPLAALPAAAPHLEITQHRTASYSRAHAPRAAPRGWRENRA